MQQLWITLRDAFDISWNVYLCDPDDPCLSDASAITYPDKNTIYVRNDGDSTRILVLLFHEILHVNFSAPGDPPLLKLIFGGKDVDKTRDREEAVVTFLAPRLFNMLVKNGMLIMPERPTIIK